MFDDIMCNFRPSSDRLGPLRRRLIDAVKCRLITTECLVDDDVNATTTPPTINTQRLYLSRRESTLHNVPANTSTSSERPSADEQLLSRRRRSGPTINVVNSSGIDRDTTRIPVTLSTSDTATSHRVASTCSRTVSNRVQVSNNFASLLTDATQNIGFQVRASENR